MRTKLYLPILLAVAFPAQWSFADGAPTITVQTAADDPRATLHKRLTDLLATTKTARWYQTSMEKLGDEVETSTAETYWMGQDKIRMEMGEGRGSGSIAVLNGDKVIGYMGGFLSFAKLTYDIGDKTVLSLRGNKMTAGGFFDDLRYVVEHWDKVESKFGANDVLLSYTGNRGLAETLRIKLPEAAPSRWQVFEKGQLVEEVTYDRVVYNAPVDTKLFEK